MHLEASDFDFEETPANLGHIFELAFEFIKQALSGVTGPSSQGMFPTSPFGGPFFVSMEKFKRRWLAFLC